MRRIVTGHDRDGKAVVIKDGKPPRVLTKEEAPGVEISEIWATHEPIPSLPVDEQEPTIDGWSYWPKPGDSLFRIVRLPPASEIEQAIKNGIDVVPAWRDCLAKAQGTEIPVEYQERGLHETNTVDYAVILTGQAWMTLDEGVEIHLTAGDCLVQNGTNHAWCNKADEPCLIAFVLLGATRER